MGISFPNIYNTTGLSNHNQNIVPTCILHDGLMYQTVNKQQTQDSYLFTHKGSNPAEVELEIE